MFTWVVSVHSGIVLQALVGDKNMLSTSMVVCTTGFLGIISPLMETLVTVSWLHR
jgi:hypothetical protein